MQAKREEDQTNYMEKKYYIKARPALILYGCNCSETKFWNEK